MGRGSDRPYTAEDWFGLRVRHERERLGWSQAELAERLKDYGVDLHPSAIAKIELRDVDRPRSIRLNEAEALADALGLERGTITEGVNIPAIDVGVDILRNMEILQRVREETASLLGSIESVMALTDHPEEVEVLLLPEKLREIDAALRAMDVDAYVANLRERWRQLTLRYQARYPE